MTKLQDLNPHGTETDLVTMIELVDRLLDEIGTSAQIGYDDEIWDGENEYYTMCEDEDETKAYQEIANRLKTLRAKMTTPPPLPTVKLDSHTFDPTTDTLSADGFFDDD